jgi:hypothetical protein
VSEAFVLLGESNFSPDTMNVFSLSLSRRVLLFFNISVLFSGWHGHAMFKQQSFTVADNFFSLFSFPVLAAAAAERSEGRMAVAGK